MSVRATLVLIILLVYSADAAAQTRNSIRFSRNLRVGEIDDADYGLTYVSQIVLGKRNAVYVAQPQDNTIRVFDSRGKFIRKIGRRGGGPGEFASIDQIGFKGDTLWVSDMAQQRVSFLTPSGQLIRSIRVLGPMIDVSARPTPARAVLSDGNLLGMPATGAKRDVPNLPLLAMDRSGSLKRKLAEVDMRGSMGVIFTGHSVINFYYPVRTDDLWAVSPDGQFLVTIKREPTTSSSPSSFFVTKVNVHGDTVFSKRFRYAPQPLSQHVRDSVASGIVTFFMSGRISRSEAERYARDSLRIPSFQPAVSQAFISNNGDLWLAREPFGRSGTNWWVLDQHGTPIRQGFLPTGFKGFAADNAHVWGVENDQWGVSYVTRYRWQ